MKKSGRHTAVRRSVLLAAALAVAVFFIAALATASLAVTQLEL